MDEHLVWREKGRRELLKTRVFTVEELTSVSPEGETGVFSLIGAADWAIVVPLVETAGEKRFVIVRQWRHGAREISLEFPGGVIEPGERPEAAAVRELEEETAYTPGRLKRLGVLSPNPAIMTNRVHIFLAEDLKPLPGQHLDADEYVDVETVPAAEVCRAMGKPPYVHALMTTALCLYLQDAGL